MLSRILSVALVASFCFGLLVEPNFASSKAVEEARISDLRRTIATLGPTKETRVEVKLRDKRKLRGYIRTVGDESFELIDLKTGASTAVPYTTVAQVRTRHISNRADTIIYFAMIAGIIALVGIFGGGDR